MTPHDLLLKLNTRVCVGALEWARRLPPITTPAAAWAMCQKATWMLWFAGFVNVPIKLLLVGGTAVAQSVIGAVPATEARAKAVLAAVSTWMAAPDDARLEDVRTALAAGAVLVEELELAKAPDLAAVHATRATLACAKLLLAAHDPTTPHDVRAVHSDAIAYYAARSLRPEGRGEIPSTTQLQEQLRSLSETVRRVMPWSLVESALARFS